MKISPLCLKSLVLAAGLSTLAGCAAPLPKTSTELMADWMAQHGPELSDEDREMWDQGRLHQPQCVMDAEGEVTCE